VTVGIRSFVKKNTGPPAGHEKSLTRGVNLGSERPLQNERSLTGETEKVRPEPLLRKKVVISGLLIKLLKLRRKGGPKNGKQEKELPCRKTLLRSEDP